MCQVLAALSYMHTLGFVHRDVRPENFHLTNESASAEVKLMHFDQASRFKPGDKLMTTRTGAPYYIAPEVLEHSYNEKCDIWSCGVLCYILLCGYPPFHGEDEMQILKMVKEEEFEFTRPFWDNISSDAKDFICKLLAKDFHARPSAAEILQHAWLTKSAQTPLGALSKDLRFRFQSFSESPKMKKAALTVIAQTLKDEELQDLKETFFQMDDDKDGTLTFAEIKNGLLQIKEDIPEDLEEVVNQLDTNGSGVIDYTEFMAATLTKKQYCKREVMWTAFKVFDTNDDGTLTKDELAARLEMEDDMPLVESMIREVDYDRDGEISFEEFCKMLQRD
eukprot:TRINITY_DN20432_c0_g1_i3.p1 TRINITY_DN20432_c0_g1~~TRINITY_DN20432_c0_g1_i3.p1  ORF type:complete len:335 (-),score=98.68 TRINITY_DN20432_c0_g1_i3:112-1116(-)